MLSSNFNPLVGTCKKIIPCTKAVMSKHDKAHSMGRASGQFPSARFLYARMLGSE